MSLQKKSAAVLQHCTKQGQEPSGITANAVLPLRVQVSIKEMKSATPSGKTFRENSSG
jgi:hypothetical protein